MTDKTEIISTRQKNYTLFVLVLVFTSSHVDRQIMGILGQPIKESLLISDTQLGLLTGIMFAVFYATLGMPMAMWADRRNRRNLISFSVFLWSGMTTLCGAATSFIQLLLLRIGVGVGEAGSNPPSHSIIADLYPKEQRATAMAIFGTGIDKIIYALIIGVWASKARLTRSTALSEMQKEYIAAARLSGLGNWRIMLRFLLPNSIAPVMVMVPMSLSGAVGAEATLSFLGVGVPITEPSLGLLISNGNDYLLSGKWWISIIPGVVLVMLVLCINVVADRIRESTNPYLKNLE